MIQFQDIASQAAQAAGTVAHRAFSSRKQNLEWKSKNQPVTVADRDAEAAAKKILKIATPDFSILAEESGLDGHPSDRYWVIDPIDGTRNYARGLPIYASAVALMEDEEILVAAVYLPEFDELYSATAGAGAQCNGDLLQANQRVECNRAMVALAASSPVRASGVFTTHAGHLTPHVGSVRVLGSTLFQYCLVANGSLDALTAFHGELWDIAPGLLIAKEAGAVALNERGEMWKIGDELLIVASEDLAQELVALTKKSKNDSI